MNKPSKLLVAIGVIAGGMAAAILFCWLSNQQQTGKLPVPPGPSSADRSSPAAAAPQPVQPPGTATPVAEIATATNWEARMDEILGCEDNATNKVRQLFELFPRLPDEGQVAAARHVSNLVSDEYYAPLGQWLMNAQLQEPVLDVLMADALSRPNSLKLPVLLEIAQNPDHAKSLQAKEALAHCLDGDYGDDWAAWRQKMETWLKENPD